MYSQCTNLILDLARVSSIETQVAYLGHAVSFNDEDEALRSKVTCQRHKRGWSETECSDSHATHWSPHKIRTAVSHL
jgi:hypothetical protein